MQKRKAHATWEGNLKEGNGSISVGSGLFSGPFTYASRFKDNDGTNPDELIGAALAGCYAMFLSGLLAKNDHMPQRIDADAVVHLGEVDDAPAITKIHLTCRADIPGIHETTFLGFAQEAKEGCPVSKALAVEIELDAALVI